LEESDRRGFVLADGAFDVKRVVYCCIKNIKMMEVWGLRELLDTSDGGK